MFRIKDTNKIGEMGFYKNKDGDYELKRIIENTQKSLFKIYRGSDYIRYTRTTYITEEQLKLIYEWTKKDYIYWEET